MKQFLVVTLTFVTVLRPVFGNLGDSYDKIDNSYGNMVERNLRDDETVSVVYHKGRYFYFVVFANGRSVLERYSHVKRSDLSEREIARFLKINSAGGTWISRNTSNERRFERSDHKADATYGKTNGNPALTVRELRGQDAERDP
jgi:hypothetical protein